MKSITAVLLALVALASRGAAARRAELAAVADRGGLVVIVGCEDPELVAGFHAERGRLVQALDIDPAKVEKVRAYLHGRGIYGPVSARTFDGRHLPYVDNLVNLVVVSGVGCRVPGGEIERVLAPRGIVMVPGQSKLALKELSLLDARHATPGAGWRAFRKPVPSEIDEWTHYLHGPDNNAVARDTVIDNPRGLQWTGGPKWSRHHDRMAGLSAAVSAKGRLFYVMDEGPIASALALPDWTLTARDAFNGIALWKRSIPDWYPHLWPLKSGPAWLPRRLVASADCVYVTLGLHAPVVQLDAATGETIRTYGATRGAMEILVDGGLLLTAVDESPERPEYRPRPGIGTPVASMERDLAAKNSPWDWSPKRIMAIDAESGETLWQTRSPVAPLSLAMNATSVVLHDGEGVVCLSRDSGREVWRTEPASSLQGSPRNWYAKTVANIGKLGKALPASFAPNLVLHKGVVLFSGGDGKLCGLDAETGKALWVGECLASGHYSPEDVLVAGGLVWTTDIAHSQSSGKVIGLDPVTGKTRRTIACKTAIHWFHQRCYRSKATERYLLTSRNGIEFIDLEAGRWMPNHWVRGGCLYGILPCNGLIYTPPHNCACYVEAKLFGFNALAGKRREGSVPGAGGRLEKGPAYRVTQVSGLRPQPSDSWPTFRAGNARGGCASTVLPGRLCEVWRVGFGARASQPTIADNKVLVAVPEKHAVVCLAADTGRRDWRFTADARVDSPPTIAGNLCVFGSADGHVYCTTMETGELAWRYRAAPDDLTLAAFGQAESVWPVSGSVLVRGNEVVFVAGRSVFLDGGLRMVRLDLRTGKLLSEHAMTDRDPEKPGRAFQYRARGLNMPVGLPDILSCDGRNICMRSQPFDLEGRRRNLAAMPSVPPADGGGRHIFSPTGFLDASWMHRSYWVYGTGFDEGAGGWPRAGKSVAAGRILCHDADVVYGYGRKKQYFQWSTPLEYHLFAAPKTPPAKGKVKGRSGPRMTYRWSRELGLHAKSMLVAGNKLCVAGPPTVINEAEAYRNPLNPTAAVKMRKQTEAFRGGMGGILKVVAADSGEDISELKLDYLPAFDSMAAAGGRLFVASEDGSLVCYGASPGDGR